MTRDQALNHAHFAALRAHELAAEADSAAHSSDRNRQAPNFAAAGSVWAYTAQAFAAIAAALPEETEATDA